MFYLTLKIKIFINLLAWGFNMGDIYQKRYNARSRLMRMFLRSHQVLFSNRLKLTPMQVKDKVVELFYLFSEFDAEIGVKLPDKKRWHEIEQTFIKAVIF